MSAAIVYDGVEPARAAEGSLFRYVKFWVARRVPLRLEYIKLITSNGGTVVPLEKHADVLIADHLRKDTPQGALSYEYIDACIKKGRLVNKEDHPAGRSQDTARPVGSSEPAKATRTPFTAEDDKILTKWVLDAARGGSARGNKIYEELAAINPRHTSQSWRDRWVKKLSHLPKSVLDDREMPYVEPATTPSPKRSRRRPMSLPEQATPSPKVTRLKFTEEDDQLLLQHVREAEEAGHQIRGMRIYERFAEKHPHHSAASWHAHFVRILAPRMNDDAIAAPRTPSHVEQRSSPSPNADETPRRSRRPDSLKDVSILEINERIRQQNLKRREKSAAELIQRTWRGYLVRKKRALPSAVRGDDPPRHSESPFPHLEPPPATPRTLRRQFYVDYSIYLESMGLDAPSMPTINNQDIDLFELWEAVHQDDVAPNEREWGEISRSLGLGYPRDDTVTNNLKRLYEEKLGSFERDFAAFIDLETEVEDDAPVAEESDAEHGSPRKADVVEVPNSSPHVRFNIPASISPSRPNDGKRPRNAGSNPPDLPRKRARVDRGSEVPCTPPERLGFGGIKSSSARDPVAFASQREASPKLPRAAFEPETQDFGFYPESQPDNEFPYLTEPETQAFGFENGSQYPVDSQDVTPSQQLRSELHGEDSDPLAVPTQEQSPSANPLRGRRPTTPGRSLVSVRPDSTEERRVSLPPPSSPGQPSRPQAALARQGRGTNRIAASSLRSASRGQKPPVSELPRPDRGGKENLPQPGKSLQKSTLTALDVEIERWMGMGYAEKYVIQGIKAATGDPGLAGVVMQRLRDGLGIPQHHEGVWTEKDDEWLALVDSVDRQPTPQTGEGEKLLSRRNKLFRKLEHKHGVARMADRRKFLAISSGGRGGV